MSELGFVGRADVIRYSVDDADDWSARAGNRGALRKRCGAWYIFVFSVSNIYGIWYMDSEEKCVKSF